MEQSIEFRYDTQLLIDSENGDLDEDNYVDMEIDDVSDSYSFKGDGKQWLDEDVEDYERFLRK